MKDRFLNIVLIIIIILLMILSIKSVYSIKATKYPQAQVQIENDVTADNPQITEDKTPLYDKIGVSKRCLYVWQVLTAEGFWPNPEPTGCSQEDIDKIEKYCNGMTDTCYSYDIDDIVP